MECSGAEASPHRGFDRLVVGTTWIDLNEQLRQLEAFRHLSGPATVTLPTPRREGAATQPTGSVSWPGTFRVDAPDVESRTRSRCQPDDARRQYASCVGPVRTAVVDDDVCEPIVPESAAPCVHGRVQRVWRNSACVENARSLARTFQAAGFDVLLADVLTRYDQHAEPGVTDAAVVRMVISGTSGQGQRHCRTTISAVPSRTWCRLCSERRLR